MPTMGANDESYEFLDCGGGRRLERFSTLLAVRPAPAASRVPALPDNVWRRADLRFEPGKGWQGDAPDDWRVNLGGVVLRLRPAGQGQVGAFPEHDAVCRLLERRLAASSSAGGGVDVLNLFAHTGLATLRLAARPETGVIVHADASKRAVAAARENAAASGLAGARVRWLVDDAMSLLAREARRGNRYGLVLADPPSHGRDKKSGREWRFERDIDELLALAARLLEPERGMLCLTCHTEGWDGDAVARRMDMVKELPRGRDIAPLALTSRLGGNPLPAGHAVLAFHA